MLILIEKDAATRVPREVKDLDEARAAASLGHAVHVQQEDGSTVPLADVLARAEKPAKATKTAKG